MGKEHLANYLNDHMAGSIVALEILEQLEKEAPELTAHMVELKTDIEADRQELKALMDRLGITESCSFSPAGARWRLCGRHGWTS